MDQKEEYQIPKITLIDLITEPFMNQSGNSLFSNKTGIRQGECSGSSSPEETFWDTNFFSKR